MTKALEREFKEARPNQWFHYFDPTIAATPLFCETDCIIEFTNHVVIVECKLTQRSMAWKKLRGLYVPIVQMALGKPTAIVQIFKNATERGPWVRVREARDLRNLQPGTEAILHWSL